MKILTPITSAVLKRIRNKFEKTGLVDSFVVCVRTAKETIFMTTLEDLYYGNISPHERYIKKGTRVDKLVKLICKNEAEFNAGLTK